MKLFNTTFSLPSGGSEGEAGCATRRHEFSYSSPFVVFGVGLGAVLAALQGVPCTNVWWDWLLGLTAQCATWAYCRTAVLAVVSESWIPDSSPFVMLGPGARVASRPGGALHQWCGVVVCSRRDSRALVYSRHLRVWLPHLHNEANTTISMV